MTLLFISRKARATCELPKLKKEQPMVKKEQMLQPPPEHWSFKLICLNKARRVRLWYK
jgi:hypothetical protein